MKFADEYFGEIKPGTVLINVDNTDDEFTKGAEYEVRQDEEGLFVVDDYGCEELFNTTLAQYFVIKEPDMAEIQARLQQAEADNALMREALELGKKACASMSCNAPDSAGCSNICYAYNFRIASDKILNSTDAGAAILKELKRLRGQTSLLDIALKMACVDVTGYISEAEYMGQYEYYMERAKQQALAELEMEGD